MKVFDRNEDGTRGRLLFDTGDPTWMALQERQWPLRRTRAEAGRRLSAVRLRISAHRFGRAGGRHREDGRRYRRDDSARLLYRLITG